MAMQDMSSQRTDLETVTSASTAPSTPALDTSEHMNKIFDALHISPTSPGDSIPPAPPNSFTQLICPVLRTDVQAYEDFQMLLEISRRSGPPSRVTSGNYGRLSGLGLSNVTKDEQQQNSNRMPSNGSTSSLSASKNHSTSGTPTIPQSTNSSISSRDSPVIGTALKETPFYKRVLTEDIEPTLRLDTAPGLSWLARRGVIGSMCEGRTIVEPMPSNAKLYLPPCSLCGEQGRGEKRARNHRFRTSESETAQRYPLCEYCLNRVRATCDFLGFLRMVKEGHWRTDSAHAEAMAWEESVRLRERMFWSRIGGGVIPAFFKGRADSPRTSSDEEKGATIFPGSQTSLHSQDTKPEIPSPLAQVQTDLSMPLAQRQELQPQELSPLTRSPSSDKPLPPPPETAELQHREFNQQDSVQPGTTRPSLGRTTTRSRVLNGADGDSRPSVAKPDSSTRGSVAKRAAMFERQTSEDQASNQLQASLQASIKGRSPSRKSPSPAAKPVAPEPIPEPQRGHKAQGSIPGAFDF